MASTTTMSPIITATSCNMDAQAHFLAGREARKACRTSRRPKTSHVEFWTAWKEAIRQWMQRVEEVSNDDPHAQEQLTQLREELIALRQQTLHNTSRNSSDSDSSVFQLPCLPPDEWPLSELRLLHAEFSACQALLDQKQSQVKNKFVFTRYRRAMKQQEQQQLEKKPPTPAQTQSTLPLSSNTNDSHVTSPTLKDLRDCQIDVYDGGRVRITALDGTTLQEIQQTQGEASPLVLCNLDNTRVVLHDTARPSLHLVHVQNSKVVCHSAVQSLHVTDCHHTCLTVTAQQVRLHESTHLRCHVHVSAGAILEECTDICFYSDEKLDVKDFDWLRTSVPSPNYTILRSRNDDKDTAPLEHQPLDSDTIQERVTVETPAPESVPTLPNDASCNAREQDVDDDDDDEEL